MNNTCQRQQPSSHVCHRRRQVPSQLLGRSSDEGPTPSLHLPTDTQTDRHRQLLNQRKRQTHSNRQTHMYRCTDRQLLGQTESNRQTDRHTGQTGDIRGQTYRQTQLFYTEYSFIASDTATDRHQGFRVTTK